MAQTPDQCLKLEAGSVVGEGVLQFAAVDVAASVVAGQGVAVVVVVVAEDVEVAVDGEVVTSCSWACHAQALWWKSMVDSMK